MPKDKDFHDAKAIREYLKKKTKWKGIPYQDQLKWTVEKIPPKKRYLRLGIGDNASIPVYASFEPHGTHINILRYAEIRNGSKRILTWAELAKIRLYTPFRYLYTAPESPESLMRVFIKACFMNAGYTKGYSVGNVQMTIRWLRKAFEVIDHAEEEKTAKPIDCMRSLGYHRSRPIRTLQILKDNPSLLSPSRSTRKSPTPERPRPKSPPSRWTRTGTPAPRPQAAPKTKYTSEDDIQESLRREIVSCERRRPTRPPIHRRTANLAREDKRDQNSLAVNTVSLPEEQHISPPISKRRRLDFTQLPSPVSSAIDTDVDSDDGFCGVDDGVEWSTPYRPPRSISTVPTEDTRSCPGAGVHDVEDEGIDVSNGSSSPHSIEILEGAPSEEQHNHEQEEMQMDQEQEEAAEPSPELQNAGEAGLRREADSTTPTKVINGWTVLRSPKRKLSELNEVMDDDANSSSTHEENQPTSSGSSRPIVKRALHVAISRRRSRRPDQAGAESKHNTWKAVPSEITDDVEMSDGFSGEQRNVKSNRINVSTLEDEGSQDQGSTDGRASRIPNSEQEECSTRDDISTREQIESDLGAAEKNIEVSSTS
ncbi:hypothetical protein BDV96DRAFT_641038 [Lophiotrema nucula]|uniref:Uncharacterized protein n=1 Tax=Lophiotrema nucula TaxID=690887 RepID=A0A6A5ZRQ1_9PLEO|nr:hypothetical protein BDV96DRAFT_641038 [Lophiotrema nucula]